MTSGIVYLKHMALFTYDDEISIPPSMEDLPYFPYISKYIAL